jgi:hypothetical protein
MWSAKVGVAALVFGATIFAANPPKPFAIQNIALSQYEDGPRVPEGHYFVPGETIFFSFQVAGYKPEGDEDQGIRVSWRIEAKDPSGIPIFETRTGKIATGISHEDKEWMPKVRTEIEIPPIAPPGIYRIAMTVKDEVANTEISKEAEFSVRGRQIEPSPTLVVRNLALYRGENDKSPLEPAVYHPGEAVWIKFFITGYKFADKNRFEVGYGITVLRPNGEPTLSNPEAAVEKDESFYPRPYVPAGLSLTLPPDVQKGQFTVVISAVDKVGGQKYETRTTFTVAP